MITPVSPIYLKQEAKKLKKFKAYQWVKLLMKFQKS